MNGPSLKYLLFCQSVESTPDGRLALLGVLDELAIGPKRTNEPIPLFVAASWLTGDEPGVRAVTLQVLSPDGSVPLLEMFTSESSSIRLSATAWRPFRLPLVPGMHWLELLLDQRLLARSPLRVLPRAQ